MKIAVDAMGGDFGPKATVPGALNAVHDLGGDIILVGLESAIRRELDRHGSLPAGLTVVDAPEAIGMAEGLLSFRKKKASSIRVAAQLVKDGRADAFVSMGNTGAVVYISRDVLGALKGVDRPALALLVPGVEGQTLLLDVGANANCQPHNLVQFAIMGKIFMEAVAGVAEPRIGLMSIGEEEGKGNDLVKEAFDRLQAAPLRFVGNVEGKDLFAGVVDVVVSDGFTGNVALKTSEGVVQSVMSMARSEITKNIFAKLGYLLMKRHLKRVYKRIDYTEYGGAQLLGLDGVCIIGHGRSNPAAVRNAIARAREFVANGVQSKIQAEILRYEHVLRGDAA
ncbi:MAG TPA: phosphate acyltransferase PlsX [Candidatus Aminicenantes bacterium]|nr:phosphate acyltransferase PlsX [Candidatus Aminicenantes bacterium]HRY64148.1 phosphate acyltransferase PlsX [Candidatus Aminicenantes bacterium]HRZ71061.1 phosphate acyltransferase PlsX [Candidatus Aminicenantes bacterium]